MDPRVTKALRLFRKGGGEASRVKRFSLVKTCKHTLRRLIYTQSDANAAGDERRKTLTRLFDDCFFHPHELFYERGE